MEKIIQNTVHPAVIIVENVYILSMLMKPSPVIEKAAVKDLWNPFQSQKQAKKAGSSSTNVQNVAKLF